MNFVIENVIADDNRIELVSSDGESVFIRVEGECCSHSFFDDLSVLDVKSLLGQRLVRIESVGMAAPENDPIPHGDDSVSHHALIIRTDAQSISVMWRNESNGYYDGNVSLTFGGDEMQLYGSASMDFESGKLVYL